MGGDVPPQPLLGQQAPEASQATLLAAALGPRSQASVGLSPRAGLPAHLRFPRDPRACPGQALAAGRDGWTHPAALSSLGPPARLSLLLRGPDPVLPTTPPAPAPALEQERPFYGCWPPLRSGPWRGPQSLWGLALSPIPLRSLTLSWARWLNTLEEDALAAALPRGGKPDVSLMLLLSGEVTQTTSPACVTRNRDSSGFIFQRGFCTLGRVRAAVARVSLAAVHGLSAPGL